MDGQMVNKVDRQVVGGGGRRDGGQIDKNIKCTLPFHFLLTLPLLLLLFLSFFLSSLILPSFLQRSSISYPLFKAKKIEKKETSYALHLPTYLPFSLLFSYNLNLNLNLTLPPRLSFPFLPFSPFSSPFPRSSGILHQNTTYNLLARPGQASPASC